jgi:hypothetical protein
MITYLGAARLILGAAMFGAARQSMIQDAPMLSTKFCN